MFSIESSNSLSVCRSPFFVLTFFAAVLAVFFQQGSFASSGSSATPKPSIAGNATSVSGVSSGAYMAHQLHVTYSDTIMGAGLIAGGPYYCAEDMSPQEIDVIKSRCMTGLPLPSDINYIQNAIDATEDSYEKGTIANPDNLKDDYVFIFNAYTASGIVPIPDQVINPLLGAGAYVLPGTLTKGVTNLYYEHYEAQVSADTYLVGYNSVQGPFYPVAHGLPTANKIFDQFENPQLDGIPPHTPCAPINSQQPTWFDIPNEFAFGNDPWIYHCNMGNEDGYDMAYYMFSQIYSDSIVESDAESFKSENMYEFEQIIFVDDPDIKNVVDLKAHGINEKGYAYVPTGFEDGTKQCRLHVALH